MFHRGQQMSERKRSPLPPPRGKLKNQQVVVTAGGGSDSDAQSVADSNSLSGESGVVENLVATTTTASTMTTASSNRKKAANNRRRGSEWEILEGLKDGQRFESKPDKYSGYLHKKRKWPLKGWHKRYFVVDKGLLVYAKNPTDIARGKLHGSVDIGLSVISTKEKRRRVDIDADEFIYHLKAKTAETFSVWVQQLRAHRLYRQHLLTYGTRDLPLIRSQGAIALLDDIDSPTSGRSKIPLTPPEVLSRDSSLPRGMKPIVVAGAGGGGIVSPGGRLAAWIVDSTPALESVNKELGLIQQNVAQLTRMLEHIETLSTSNSTAGDAEINPDGSSPNVKKDRKKFGLRKKKSSKGSSVDLTTSMNASVNPENASPLSTCSFSSLSAVPNATLSASNSSLSTVINSSSSTAAMMITAPFGASRPHSLPGTDHLQAPTCSIVSSGGNSSGGGSCTSDRQFLSGTPDNQLRDDFTILAKDVVSGIKGVLFTMLHERDRLKTAVDGETATTGTPGSAPGGTSVAGVRAALTHALQQNAELRGRLAKVHEASDLSEISSAGPASEIVGRHFATSLSYSSSCVSASEFYDAEDAQGPTIVTSGDYTDGFKEAVRADGESDELCDGGVDAQHGGGGDATDTSSEAGSLTSEEGSVSSENSEIGTEYNAESSLAETGASGAQWTGRRTKLPVPRPDTEGFSLWNLLCKNIGKDLSQISMPVALNEPLNMLQRLCEELEYSELLDKASELDDPFERMVYVAAFAVSSYASSYYRAGNKPFNPLLGETYECVRDDRGFRFVSEQVSHHPPVSACHADGRSFVFWQDARIKTKFWGKSMEFQPIGTVNVHLLKHGAHYAWNKVTTCVHDLFGQRRSVDRYGELVIRDLNDADISCRLTFIKASRWSASRHEVRGVITGPDGKILKRLFGRWSEALYCSDDGSSKVPCSRLVWRPGAMPADHELYYGFTQFAIELNELGPEVPYLPPTDSRFRPDQRALERGDLDAAERLKLQVEQGQRDRRKRNDVDGINFEPKWFSKRINSSGEEVWDFNGKYWETRKSPGFANIAFETLW